MVRATDAVTDAGTAAAAAPLSGRSAHGRPWEALPPEVAAALKPELPALADEIVAAVREQVAAYGTGALPPRLRVGVEEALRQFVEMIEHPEADPRGGAAGAGREIYVGLGRGEMRAGRGLDALLAAYRLGARIAWRRLAAAGARAGLSPETMYRLAESIFAYIDELSAESAEGYAQEQSAAAGEAQRRRRRLVALLLQVPPADPAVVESAAEEAGWPLPRALAVVVLEGADPERMSGRLGTGVIGARVDGSECVVVPDPAGPGRLGRLEAAVARLQQGSAGRPPEGGRPSAALGPEVPWQEAAVSFELARDAVYLARAGAFGVPRLVVAEEHATDLLIHRERRLLRDLDARLLEPLAPLGPAARRRLRDTLLTWLRHQGRIEPVARELHVHPQTVRYRLGRVREHLGDVLDDPERRLELELALRAEHLETRAGGRGERAL